MQGTETAIYTQIPAFSNLQMLSRSRLNNGLQITEFFTEKICVHMPFLVCVHPQEETLTPVHWP